MKQKIKSRSKSKIIYLMCEQKINIKANKRLNSEYR